MKLDFNKSTYANSISIFKNFVVATSLISLLSLESCTTPTKSDSSQEYTESGLDSNTNTMEFHPVEIDSLVAKKFLGSAIELCSLNGGIIDLSSDDGTLHMQYVGDDSSDRVMIFGFYHGEKLGAGVSSELGSDGSKKYQGASSINGINELDPKVIEKTLKGFQQIFQQAKADTEFEDKKETERIL